MIELEGDLARILIVKPSAIGDVVHTLPVLNLLRTRWPSAHIAWLVTPACAGLLDGHPQLNEVILFDRKRLGASWKNPSLLTELFGFTRTLRQKDFDLAIDLQGLLRSGWLTWKTRARHRVGFVNAREGATLFYNHRVNVGTTEQHAIDRYMTMAERLGCGRGPVKFIFPTTNVDRDVVAQMLPAGKRYAVLLPGTNWPTKRWSVDAFAAMVTPLREKFGLEAVVAGGPDAAELAPRIGGINLTNRTTLRQLVALLERADIVIANDSGPMHIAAALGRPLVTMFGPTNPIRTGPYERMDSVIRLDIPCSPCYSRTCSHQSCLQWLRPESVLKQVEALCAPSA